MLRRSMYPVLGLLGMLVAAQATASISLSATRVVFDGAHKEANVIVRNGNQEVLVQSWVDSGDSAKAPAPFAVTPPLARVMPKQEQLLRILYEGQGLPTDRESVVWLNVQEIPQASTKANTLQLAVRQRIKIFFRPADLPGNALLAPEQLVWQLTQRGGHAQLTVNNPSLFHVSMADIELKRGKQTVLSVDSTMIAPRANRTFSSALSQVEGPLTLTFKSINDYGAQHEYSVQLNTAQPGSAKPAEPAIAL
ncbi:molecular chaperone [Pseudomonas sp. SWI6]|uniref:Molecular chaperone n=1 Tax=Pseudomonas taiwanensis TaxID=470150 RepID=A0ABR6VCY3_9PSED|nr:MULTISPECIES: molecular chaperone [Pseudomonas]AGZ34285.1 Pili assembly chaperone [Pseudomonas sp. VLB120]AVD84165.1 molecular chaperone [Pseudomonas sp. SWI6]AVD86376.1 molecular chaperone [Pseudomonas sp. SWI44]MBC3478393.1 molecular chaperone [Pseudomonas taiwanensis]MBC3493793.1 molecular chaperone [Pseudomonas taiwanensis]